MELRDQDIKKDTESVPEISIVLPVYNGEKYLKESVESIIGQTYDKWELIIVNDCSTDATSSIAHDYVSKDTRIKVIENSINKKLPESLNIGFRSAKGKYFTWTSDDNLFDKNALIKMKSFLDCHANVGLVYTDEYVINDAGIIIGTESRLPCGIYALNCVGASFMYRRECYEKIGEYNADMILVEDYDYWLRIWFEYDIAHIPETLYYYRVHQDSLSFTNTERVQKQKEYLREFHLEKILKKITPKQKELLYCIMWQYNPNNAINNKNKFWKKGLPEHLCWTEEQKENNKQKPLILLGCGKYGKKALDCAGEKRVFCFADNNKDLEGETKYGKRIISYDKMKEIASGYTIVLSVGIKNTVELSEQLERDGIQDYITFVELVQGGRMKKNVVDTEWRV